jgi:hypothetical protein
MTNSSHRGDQDMFFQGKFTGVDRYTKNTVIWESFLPKTTGSKREKSKGRLVLKMIIFQSICAIRDIHFLG